MKITPKFFKIKDLVEGYINKDNTNEGVFSMNGKLVISPEYQRNFVYDTEKRNKVIDSVINGFPIGIGYFAVNYDENGEVYYEVIDSRQRIQSICEFAHNNFSIKIDDLDRSITSLPQTIKEQFFNYEILIYLCEGTEEEVLKWFERINIAGEKLTSQELLNASYCGPFVSECKKYFSKLNGPAYGIAREYLSGNCIRQDYLETVLKWVANKENKSVTEYLSENRHKRSCIMLWQYFCSVINWVKLLFPKYRKEMKGIEWGILYNKYHENEYNAEELEEKIKMLMADDDVTKKKGIYEYVLNGNEKALSIRAFSDTQKRTQYEKQEGVCPYCKDHFEFEEMEGDHIIPWSKGGKTTPDNLEMICKKCNLKKSNK